MLSDAQKTLQTIFANIQLSSLSWLFLILLVGYKEIFIHANIAPGEEIVHTFLDIPYLTKLIKLINISYGTKNVYNRDMMNVDREYYGTLQCGLWESTPNWKDHHFEKKNAL